MASSLSKRQGHQEGILSVLHHFDDDDDDDNNITMKVVAPLQRRIRSVSADMSNDQITCHAFSSLIHSCPVSEDVVQAKGSKEEVNYKNDGGTKSDHVNSWFAPKTETAVETAPPYVHPLVKKSASAVSLKSLEACTESLGSESGFSPLPIEDGKKQEEEQVGSSTSITRRMNKPRSSFPPPLPSLSYHHHHQDAGQSLHVRSHRNLGRLVLEATAHPIQTNNFQAQREDGRLLLAFTTDNKEEDEEEETGSDHTKEDQVELGEEDEEDKEDETRVLQSCKLDPSKTSLHSWGEPPPHLLLTS